LSLVVDNIIGNPLGLTRRSGSTVRIIVKENHILFYREVAQRRACDMAHGANREN
jgi:hypothetical protein